jgi:hypothetical protein
MKGLPVIGGWLAVPAANLSDIDPQCVEPELTTRTPDSLGSTIKDQLQELSHRNARSLGALGQRDPSIRQIGFFRRQFMEAINQPIHIQPVETTLIPTALAGSSMQRVEQPKLDQTFRNRSRRSAPPAA